MKLLLAGLMALFAFTSIQAQSLRINELMSSNSGAVTDADGETSDWIEIYNAGTVPVALNGYGLSDKKATPFLWTFPDYKISAGEYLLVFASGKDRRTIPGYWNTIISKGDDWKYLVPTTEPPSNWRTIDFNESGWLTGKSGFGFGDDDDNTRLTNASCVFMRKKFSITSVQDVQQLVLHMDFDDGFVAYLNGKEIARVNMTGKGDFPPYNALASDQHEALIYQGLSPEKYLISDPGSVLKAGENILAIQVHNIFTTSTDLSAIPFLSVSTTSQPAPPRIIASLNLISTQLHTNFKIDADGESIYLTKPTGQLADSVRMAAIPSNHSYGRTVADPSKWSVFPASTPGKVNSGTDLSTETPGDPQFNLPGGIYPQAQKIKLTPSSPGDTIFYTVDGSEPTKTSAIYMSEIALTGSQVIRAKVLKSGMLPGKTVTNSYIVGSIKKNPVVSISMNPNDLWDYNTGIYVKGPNAQTANPYFGANFWQDWEKSCHFELFETTGKKEVDVDAGTKIFGNWSRANNQKSMAFYCRKSYGYESINYKIFPDQPYTEFKDIVLRNSGNDWNLTMFRDGLMTGLTKGLNIDYQAFRSATIYLNGAYWGILNLREKVNEHFLAAHHDVDPDEIILLDNNSNPIIGNPDSWKQLYAFIEQNSLVTQANFEKVTSQIDFDNYLNYTISQIYFANHDWPGNNIKYWKTTDPSSKWRWIIFDTDFGMGYWDNAPQKNSIDIVTATNGTEWHNLPWSTLMLRKLLENTSFRNQFANRFCDLMNSAFLPERVVRAVDQKQNMIIDEIGNHLQKWSGGSVSNWQGAVQVIRNFALLRPNFILYHVQNKFGFKSVQPLITRADSTQGSIQLNSLKLTKFPWTGNYFPDVPVTLTAIPNAGYRFVKWTGVSTGSTSPTINVTPQAGLDITALFENDGSHYEDVIINEISYNNAADRNPGDWIELYNKGKYDIDLSGWKLTDSDPDHQFIFAANTWLKAGEYLVIANDLTKMKAVFGPLKNLQEPFAFNFGLSNLTDAVKLYSRQNQLIDEVVYSNSEPWQTFEATELWSLELIDPTKNNNSGRNWVLSQKDGTPGMRNTPMIPDGSEELPIAGSTENSTCVPNPFTDGTFIRFTPKFTANYQVTIKDVGGKEILKISQPGSFTEKQSIYWNGQDRNGRPVAPGIYFYTIEANGFREVGKVIKMQN